MSVNAHGMRADQIEVEEADGGILDLARFLFLSPVISEIRLWDPEHPMTDREFFALLCQLTIAGAKLCNDVPLGALLQPPLRPGTLEHLADRLKWSLHIELKAEPAETIPVGKRYYMHVEDSLERSLLTDYRLGLTIRFRHLRNISTLPV